MSIKLSFFQVLLPLALIVFLPAGMPLAFAAQNLAGQNLAGLPDGLNRKNILEHHGINVRTGDQRLTQVAQAEPRRRRTRSKARRSRKTGAATAETARGSAGEVAGRYAVLRTKNKDAGCLVSLNRSGRAQVGPGCQDHGFQVFDPVRWSLQGGQIILRARAGHRISFSRKADGTWQRSPAGKTALGIRKY